MNLTFTLNPGEYNDKELLNKMLAARKVCGYATSIGDRMHCTCESVRENSSLKVFCADGSKVGPCDSAVCPALQ